ncbi:MAG: zf-HC2 domain-containing protein [Polyangiaceae bacterium]|nr:zf-HC2 domain-containing protein [Polyangiaceae bacterium]
MTTARALVRSTCRRLAVAVETFVDGELLPSQVVEVETHLAECPTCREEVALTRAARMSLRAQAARAPSSLRDRLKLRLEQERASLEVEAAPPSAPRVEAPLALVSPSEPVAPVAPIMQGAAPPRRPSRRSRAALFVPLAAVAAAATFVALREPTKQPVTAEARPTLVNSAGVMPLDGILDELVALHAQPLPPEVTTPEEVRKFDPFVGVPVEAPKLQPFGARWVGGRILPIQGSRTAVLQYSMGSGHRVTVYVYDPSRVSTAGRGLTAGASPRLSRSRMVRNVPVLVGHVRGYNVAATEKKGVGYALATDLDEPESAELVAASGP